MRTVTFALTTLDAQMVPPEDGFYDLIAPPWFSAPLERVPVVRLFGATAQGASVCAHVHGFRPFFCAELSDEVGASLLVQHPQRLTASQVPHDTRAEVEHALSTELATQIQTAMARAGRPKARVVGFGVEQRCSIYGYRGERTPFLYIELADFRDIDVAAGIVQRGEIPVLGRPQAHEAHLPFLLHFLAEHQISGAGCVRVCGTQRGASDGTNGMLAPQTNCTIELDVRAPEGVLNYGEHKALLQEAGTSTEARVRTALHSMLGVPGATLAHVAPPATAVVAGEAAGGRPTCGGRTTSLEARRQIQGWLRGGEPPSTTSADFAMRSPVMGALAAATPDIEDLAGCSPKTSKKFPVRAAASPPRYWDSADDPSRAADAKHPAARRSLRELPRVPEQSPSKAAAGQAARLSAAVNSLGTADAQWEDIVASLAVEVLCIGSDQALRMSSACNPQTDPVVAVCYAVRPHCCQLGGQRLQRADKRGAIIVTGHCGGAAMWPGDELGDIHVAENEGGLFDKLAGVIRTSDPDLCLGWELRNHSWGFLLKRTSHLGDMSLWAALVRAPLQSGPISRHRRESDGTIPNEGDMIAPGELQVPGRLVLNVWRVLMNLTFGLKLRSYAPQEAARELLGRNVPLVPQAELARLWKAGGLEGRCAALRHVQALAMLSLEAFDALEVLPRAAELARLFGTDVLSGFTRGTQLRVEALLTRVARAAGFALLSASGSQVRAQPALECLPLVMEPESGWYWDPCLVLDFKGMYPSLICAHNISYDTCLGRTRRVSVGPTSCLGVRDEPWPLSKEVASRLGDAFDGEPLSKVEVDSPVRWAPGDCLFVGPSVRRGLLPLMLVEVIRLRTQAKKAMKTAPPAVAKRLNQRQFALKMFANVTYGYVGASFSGRMPCAEIADTIVGTGRRALEEATQFIEAADPRAHVVYGDTDSLFVQLRGATLDEAFVAGRQLCEQISALHPTPVELEFEKVYYPCVCLTKKRYGGVAYTRPPSEGGTPEFEAKGLEVIRRDQCRLVGDFQRDMLFELFKTKDMSATKRLFVRRITELLRGGTSGPLLKDFVINREARLGTYRAEDEDGGGATLPPQAAVAYNLMAAEGEFAAPEFGERVAYVVSSGPSTGRSRLVDRCVAPTEVAEGGAHAASDGSLPRLDRWWYAEKAILPVIVRILHSDLHGLPPVKVENWLREVPRPSSSNAGKGGRGPLQRFLRRRCSHCGTADPAPGTGVCAVCASPEVRTKAKQRVAQASAALAELRSTCCDCAGPLLWRSCAAAAHCPIFARRIAAEEEERQAAEDVSALGPDPHHSGEVCMVSDSESCVEASPERNRCASTLVDSDDDPADSLSSVASGESAHVDNLPPPSHLVAVASKKRGSEGSASEVEWYQEGAVGGGEAQKRTRRRWAALSNSSRPSV